MTLVNFIYRYRRSVVIINGIICLLVLAVVSTAFQVQLRDIVYRPNEMSFMLDFCLLHLSIITIK